MRCGPAMFNPSLEDSPNSFPYRGAYNPNSHKVEQRRLSHRGREFHFVSYEAQLANERRGVEAVPPMWYLMNEGKRRPVLPHVPGQELVELDDSLRRWVDEQVFGSKAVLLQRQRK